MDKLVEISSNTHVKPVMNLGFFDEIQWVLWSDSYKKNSSAQIREIQFWKGWEHYQSRFRANRNRNVENHQDVIEKTWYSIQLIYLSTTQHLHIKISKIQLWAQVSLQCSFFSSSFQRVCTFSLFCFSAPVLPPLLHNSSASRLLCSATPLLPGSSRKNTHDRA